MALGCGDGVIVDIAAVIGPSCARPVLDCKRPPLDPRRVFQYSLALPSSPHDVVDFLAHVTAC